MTDVVTTGEIAAWWPVPGAASHKYTRGVVGIDAGSRQYPGAALLAIAGALGAGPGMVRYLGSAPRDLVVGRFPSVVLADGQVQAVVVGSGWGALDDAAACFQVALERRVPLVVDADALRQLPADLPAEGPSSRWPRPTAPCDWRCPAPHGRPRPVPATCWPGPAAPFWLQDCPLGGQA